MFRGESQHTLDDKFRLTIPGKFREELGVTFVVTKGMDNCLYAYPMREWEELEGKLRNLPLAQTDVRRFVRFFVGSATECELDKQSRILLPATLRDYASLNRDCVIVGVTNRVEIWAKEVWTQETWVTYDEQTRKAMDEVGEKLTGLGL